MYCGVLQLSSLAGRWTQHIPNRSAVSTRTVVSAMWSEVRNVLSAHRWFYLLSLKVSSWKRWFSSQTPLKTPGTSATATTWTPLSWCWRNSMVIWNESMYLAAGIDHSYWWFLIICLLPQWRKRESPSRWSMSHLICTTWCLNSSRWDLTSDSSYLKSLGPDVHLYLSERHASHHGAVRRCHGVSCYPRSGRSGEWRPDCEGRNISARGSICFVWSAQLVFLSQVSDRGGGVPLRKIERLFTYTYSTAPRPSLDSSHAAPLVSIPEARLQDKANSFLKRTLPGFRRLVMGTAFPSLDCTRATFRATWSSTPWRVMEPMQWSTSG